MAIDRVVHYITPLVHLPSSLFFTYLPLNLISQYCQTRQRLASALTTHGAFALRIHVKAIRLRYEIGRGASLNGQGSEGFIVFCHGCSDVVWNKWDINQIYTGGTAREEVLML